MTGQGITGQGVAERVTAAAAHGGFAALGLIIGGLVCLVLVLLGLWALMTYNRLIRQRNQVQASWAQIDVQLKRRYDLIPNLVETVRGYADHERSTLDAVVQARNSAISAANAAPATRAEAENALTQTLGRLFALAEAYPNLKASENFLGLQSELAGTEDKIAYARQFYNSAVQTFNTSIQSVPTNIVAGMGGFRVETLFEAAGAERGPVQVRF
jgi:LemA protein